MSPAQYEIAALADFLKVPPDRLDACLSDFVYWLQFSRAVAGIKGVEAVQRFTWIDDGVSGLSSLNLEFRWPADHATPGA